MLMGLAVGVFLYDTFFFVGAESIINTPCVNFFFFTGPADRSL
jgi:hypothetical protein